LQEFPNLEPYYFISIFRDLPAKAIGAKRDAINKILDKKLALIQQLSGGLGGKSHAEASSSSLDF
jgi:hypothetical protein